MSIAAASGELAGSGACAIAAIVAGDAEIAFLTVRGIEDGIAASWRQITASQTAAAIASVVYAVIADFTEPCLCDAVAAFGTFTCIGAVVVIDVVAVVALFAGIDDIVTATDLDAVDQAGGSFFAIIGTIIALFVTLASSVAAGAVIFASRLAPVFTVAFFITFAFAVAAIRFNFAAVASGFCGSLLFFVCRIGRIGESDGITFFITAHEAVTADGGAGAWSHIEESGECEFEVGGTGVTFGLEEADGIDATFVEFVC